MLLEYNVMYMYAPTIAWDLLRVDVFGFEALCEDFFKQFPDHFMSPLRLSGSAVESLFSQLKFTTAGKLDAVNFRTAQAALLTKQAISTHHSAVGYRDGHLCVQSLPPTRKQYCKHNKK